MKILFVADIYARPGRRVAADLIPRLVRERDIDLCVANGENAAGGFGITEKIARKLVTYGIDVITSGNHIWNRPDFPRVLAKDEHILRPLNYPQGAAGHGSAIVSSRSGNRVGVVNLQGRTFMPSIDCPFTLGRAEVERLKRETPVVFVDFHAEATAEKVAMGRYLDGLASAVIGTHTHVQTADERILHGGTAYLTDAGMTGVHDSVIGTRPEIAIKRFVDQVPARFKPADGRAVFCGAIVDIDPNDGRAIAIERLQLEEREAAAAVPDDDED